MAEHIRRHPLAFGSLSIVLITALALLLVWPGPLRSVQADQTFDPVDAVAWGQVQKLLTDAGLDPAALAAANGNDTQVEAVLAGLRSYYLANRSAWTTQVQALADQKNLVDLYKSRINNGLDEMSNLTQARQELVTLQANYESSMASLRATVLSTLSEGQRTLIDQMRQTKDLPMPYRVLALSAEQRIELQKALVRFHQNLSVATTDEVRDQIERQFATDLENAVGANNLSILNNLKTYLSAASERVVNTTQRVFPVQD